MNIINSIGRSDTHAKTVTNEDMNIFRDAMHWLEEYTSNLLE
jgi:hypothetical protein